MESLLLSMQNSSVHLGESMFLQKGRLTNFVLRERGRDLLDEGFIDAPPALETFFGEVVKTDRRRHGTEENMPGTRVLPESANRSGGKVSSETSLVLLDNGDGL